MPDCLILTPARRRIWRPARLLSPLAFTALSGCAAVGSMMSPYSEKFSCKNSDHGQCVHPDNAYADAVAGRPGRSEPAVTNDKKLLRDAAKVAGMPGVASGKRSRGSGSAVQSNSFLGYRDSVYRELRGLIDQPVTPMLKAPRTVRTLILPYADRERPDRLYMPRYVFSILETPAWVVGDYLVDPVQPSAQAPVLGQVQDGGPDMPASPAAAMPIEAPRR